MIQASEPKDLIPDKFVVCDIENRRNGDALAICFCWRDNGELNYRVYEHDTDLWESAWEWLKIKAEYDKRFRKVYAHNGGGWDWLSLAGFLLDKVTTDDISISVVTSGSSMVVMSVRVGKKYTIQFCDSLQLLRSSLDKLSKVLLGEGKLDIDNLHPETLLKLDKDRFYEYLRRDCYLLLNVLEKSLTLIHEKVAPIGELGVTIGSTAYKVFKTIGGFDSISIPWKEELKSFLREGYKGGRVEVFRYGYYSKVNVYDINSLYPYVMSYLEVPVSDRGYWVDCLELDKPSCYRISYEQKDKSILPILMSEGRGSYKGEGVYFSPEISLLLELDKNCVIEVEQGYVFADRAKIFGKYVETLYNLRLTDEGGPVSLLCKYLMNSLYGKFGQSSLRDKLISVDSFAELCSMVEDGAVVTPLSDTVYTVTQEVNCEFEHVGISGIITSEARAVLFRFINEQKGKVTYCDTDSIHTTGDFNLSKVNTRLGSLKCEFTGEGVYCGKKLYALRNKEQEKLRVKGVPVGGVNGCNLNFADILSLLQDKRITCEFSRPTTMLNVFKGSKPCKFDTKTRTIRKT